MNIEQINHEEFSQEFLKEYLAFGLSNLPKKEIDHLVLKLLLRHHSEWDEKNPPSAFTLAQSLKAKRGKIRSMLDELSFRSSGDMDLAKEKLRTHLKEAEKHIEQNKVKIQIEDSYIREYAKSIVQEHLGIVDTSFDRTIINVSGDKYLTLISEVLGDQEKQALERDLNNADIQNRESLPLTKVFITEFVKGAGKETGKNCIRLGSALLSGGLSELAAFIEAITSSEDVASPATTPATV